MSYHWVEGARRRPRVGSPVRVRLGGAWVPARVIEDRGPIGVEGRRIVRVRARLGAETEVDFELPLEHLRVPAHAA